MFVPDFSSFFFREQWLAMSPGDRMMAGPVLFDLECEWRKSVIRTEQPHWTEDQVSALLAEQLDRERSAEEEGVYVTVPFSSDGVTPDWEWLERWCVEHGKADIFPKMRGSWESAHGAPSESP